MTGSPDAFDPDKLYLTKAQIVAIGDDLIRDWKKNEKANMKMILIAKTAQFLIKRYGEEEIQKYYKDFWQKAYGVMQKNALQGNPELSLLKRAAELRNAPPVVQQEKPKKITLAELMKYGAMKESA